MPQAASPEPVTVLYPCPTELTANRINMNWTQRVLLVPPWVRLIVITERKARIDVILPANVRIIRPRLPGTAGFLLAAGFSMLSARWRGVRIVMTDRSVVSLLAPVFRRVGGYRWVLDIWDAPHKELVSFHRMSTGVKARMRLLASSIKVAGLRMVARYADLVIASVMPETLSAYRIPTDRLRVFGNAIELPSGTIRRSSALRPPSVCFISRRILKDRRMDLLTAAVRQLRAEGIEVQVTVAGEIPDATRAAIDGSDVSESIEFLGTISLARAHEIMSASRVGVIPLEANEDLSFIYPVKLLEYMAYGCVVVASDLPGTRAIVRDGCEALLVPPGDGPALTNALKRALIDDMLCERLTRAAADRIANFDSRRKTRQIYSAVSDLVATESRTKETD